MSSFMINPKVDAAQEFIEIATDFSNPLDIVREAISNAFDAKATNIQIIFEVAKEFGENILVTKLRDNGSGMDVNGLQSFFDLGNSRRRGNNDSIGEKGHGTKVYFHSSQVVVQSCNAGKTYIATMNDPFKRLHNRDVPEVSVDESDTPEVPNGTLITIKGYNSNRRDQFKQSTLKDYIMWFTKFGSFEKEVDIFTFQDVNLFIQGLDVKEPEQLNFGHYFPKASDNISALFDEHLVDAPQYYSKKIIKKGNLKNFPEIAYQAIFSIEGNKVKQEYNQMLKRSGNRAGIYTVQERYGLWLCKDFIPIQRANDWFGIRGTEFTRFHAFINCQDFRLTANRGSINNTPAEILDDLKLQVQKIYDDITNSDDWDDIEYLESQVDAHRNTTREKKDFEIRKKKFNSTCVAEYKGHLLTEPTHESGVFGLLLQLCTIEPRMFPFQILDSNTHQGFDLLVKGDNSTPIQQSKLFYVELKFTLSNKLNHSFDNLNSIVCWDTRIKHDDVITDINDNERVMHIVEPIKENDYTKYFLDNAREVHRIQVFVLKDYLMEKFKIEFRPRTDKTTI